MKTVLIAVFKFFLRIIYAPMKLFKTQNKIVYLSRQSNNKSLDMRMLEEEIAKECPDTKQVFRLKMIDDGFKNKFKYLFFVFGDMYQLATSKVAICDTYSIAVSCLNHKENLKVVQIWHALGAVKKFGLQSIGLKDGRDEKVSKAMCMHKNYDYVISPSVATAVAYSEAFGTEKSKIKISSLPRVDYILNEKNRKNSEFYSKNPALSIKKIILYLPTFRNREGFVAEELKTALEDKDEFKLIIKQHPLSRIRTDERYSYDGDFSTYDLMKIADIIITDYSATAFEAALLMKPLYFFVPDYELYKSERGLNVELKDEIPSSTFENGTALVDSMENLEYNYDELFRFKEKYVQNTGNNNTNILAKFIAKLM